MIPDIVRAAIFQNNSVSEFISQTPFVAKLRPVTSQPLAVMAVKCKKTASKDIKSNMKLNSQITWKQNHFHMKQAFYQFKNEVW